jgi:hypothetical protein
VIAISVLLVLAFFVLSAVHAATGLAVACLLLGLVLLHPVRAVLMFCIAAVVAVVVAGVDVLLRVFHPRDRHRESSVGYPIAPSGTSQRRPAQNRPAQNRSAQNWQGQASPFLDRHGRHLDDDGRRR